MQSKSYRLHNGQTGAALAVRVTPRASKNAVTEILNDGTVKIHLTASGGEKKINASLVEFLAKILEIPADRLDVVAGHSGNDKLVSILDLDAKHVQERILKNLV
jgi:uncharacterized protein YggU (UPF0235/DUF167 family)